jgi:hypothetical protein
MLRQTQKWTAENAEGTERLIQQYYFLQLLLLSGLKRYKIFARKFRLQKNRSTLRYLVNSR